MRHLRLLLAFSASACSVLACNNTSPPAGGVVVGVTMFGGFLEDDIDEIRYTAYDADEPTKILASRTVLRGPSAPRHGVFGYLGSIVLYNGSERRGSARLVVAALTKKKTMALGSALLHSIPTHGFAVTPFALDPLCANQAKLSSSKVDDACAPKACAVVGADQGVTRGECGEPRPIDLSARVFVGEADLTASSDKQFACLEAVSGLGAGQGGASPFEYLCFPR